MHTSHDIAVSGAVQQLPSSRNSCMQCSACKAFCNSCEFVGSSPYMQAAQTEMLAVVAQAQEHSCCRNLDLSECRGVSGSALQSILTGAMPALESVMLTGIPEVSNTLLAEMALGLPLRHINVARCTAVSDEGLRGLAAACPQLLSLQADACIKITDAGVVALSESCRELQVCEMPLVQQCRAAQRHVCAASSRGQKARVDTAAEVLHH